MAQQVLVLNATYEPINICSLQRAVVLVLKQRAEVLEHARQRLRSAASSYLRPLVIRLVNYVRIPRHESRRVSRKAVFARDGFRCQYCGDTHSLTVDHVVPRSRGGSSAWTNVVTSCAPCNRRKANRLPAEIGMFPARAPRPPSPEVFLVVAPGRRPESWRPYLARRPR